MSSVNIRPELVRTINSENDHQGANMMGKSAVAVAGGLKTRGLRSAMVEIGNNAGIKATKPPRAMIKQKAVVSLKNVEAPTRIMPKRKSTEKASTVEPMDISKTELKNEDVEMEDINVKVEPAPVAFSSDRLLLVEDIDKDDQSDPQLVSEYVKDIYCYLRQLEHKQSIEKDYLGNKKGGVILPKMRAVLIDWLVEVHQQFNMLQETLYLTVAILDRFLQNSAHKISRKSLQLVGVTAMFIASKYEEMYAPEIGDFVYITDNAYTQSQIRQMEVEIMRVLNFDLGRPLPLHFLRRNSKAGCVDARIHTLAKYIMELTLLEYNMMHIPPSKLASAALVTAVKFFDNEDKPLNEHWTATLAFYSMYEWSDLTDLVSDLIDMIKKTCAARSDAKLMAIRCKYSSKKFGKIALVAQSKVEVFENMKPELLLTSTPK